MDDLQPIKFEGMNAYFLNDLEQVMNHDYFMKLQAFLIGQTVGVKDGKILVYEHDLRRFLQGQDSLE